MFTRRSFLAQTAVVGKTRSVVLASSAAVVVLIMLCMVATFTGSVLERRKDFAVMKALGASNRTVNFLFASEAALLALAGSDRAKLDSIVRFYHEHERSGLTNLHGLRRHKRRVLQRVQNKANEDKLRWP